MEMQRSIAVWHLVIEMNNDAVIFGDPNHRIWPLAIDTNDLPLVFAIRVGSYESRIEEILMRCCIDHGQKRRKQKKQGQIHNKMSQELSCLIYCDM